MREYLLVFLVAAATTYLLTVIAREIALRTGAVAKVRDRDVHAVPIPYLGGLAMLGGLVAAYVVARELPFLSLSGPFVFRDAGVVLIAGALICAVGVLDDLFELDALTKLGGQVLAAGFLIAFGIQYVFFHRQRRHPVPLQPGAGGAAHRVRGGGDGQRRQLRRRPRRPGRRRGRHRRARRTSSSATSWPTSTTSSWRPPAALLSAALAGACVGFLPHNFHQARLFMGDSGSMLIGLVLVGQRGHADRAVRPRPDQRGRRPAPRPACSPTLLPLLLPVSILIVPMLDLVLAVVRRTRAGRSPFAPDKQHLHHRLLEIGHSHRRAVLIMYLWAALVAFGTVLASLYGDGTWTWVARGAMAAVTIALTFVLPTLHHPPSRRSGRGRRRRPATRCRAT